MVDGKPWSYILYERIIHEQMLIANLSNGSITLTETDDMPIHNRKFILNTLRQAREAADKKREELRAQRKQNASRKPRKHPRKR